MATAIDIRDLPARLDEVLAMASAGGEVILLDGSTHARGSCLWVQPPEGGRTAFRGASAHSGFQCPARRRVLVGAVMKLLLDTRAFIWWSSIHTAFIDYSYGNPRRIRSTCSTSSSLTPSRRR